jgi:hypothetical protein
MCDGVEKTSKGRQKKRIIGRANNQVLAHGPAHDFKLVQCELKGKSKGC